MNIFLWILQILLSLHTLIGAVWKFSNPEQSVPSLNIIPHSVWLILALLEILCSIALVLPAFNKSKVRLIPIAAACIGAEMLIFSGLHLYSGSVDYGPLIYWLVVAALCAFIAYARFMLIKSSES